MFAEFSGVGFCFSFAIGFLYSMDPLQKCLWKTVQKLGQHHVFP